MNIKSKRGEVITLTVVAFALISAVVGMWFGQSKYAKVVGLGGPDGQKVRQIEYIKSEPIAVKGQDGKTYWLQKTETRTEDTTEEPKMTLVQKLLVLPKAWLLLMILGLFFPPIAGVMGYINNNLKKGAKQIVAGVEKGLATIPQESKDKVLNELSKTYDAKTKLMVAKIKQK